MQPVRSMLDPFHRGNGSGSRNASDDWADETSIFHNEWGSTAATTFNPDGTDGQGQPIPKSRRDFYKRLYRHQNGYGESDRKDTIRASHRLNDAEMFMSVLEMPSTQRETVLQILEKLDISSNNFGGRPYEKVILAVCSLVSDEALSSQPNPSLDNRLSNSDAFTDLMGVNDMSRTELRRIRRSVKEKSSYFD